jgi:hypothetical protein
MVLLILIGGLVVSVVLGAWIAHGENEYGYPTYGGTVKRGRNGEFEVRKV